MAAALRQEFTTRFIWGLKLCGLGFRDMNILERRIAIKRAADVAMGSTPYGAICNHTRICNFTRVTGDSNVMKRFDMFNSSQSSITRSKKIGRNRVLRYGNHVRKQSSRRITAAVTAERVISKQTKKLRNIIPGGKFVNTTSLLSKAANYILFLQAQVSVMNHVANVLGGLRDPGRKDASIMCVP